MSASNWTTTDQVPVRIRRPGLLYRKWPVFAIRVVTLIVVLVGWQLLANRTSLAMLAGPLDVAKSFYNLVIVKHTMLEALGGSVGAMFIGLSASIIIGIPMGFAMGRFKTFEIVVDPYVTFLYVLPSVAFIPVLVVMLGIDIQLRLTLIFLSGLFPLLINVIAGVKAVDPELVDGGRSFCASEWQIMRTIILPGTIPFIFAGLRIAFSAAWVGTIVAEMTALITGVGGMMLNAASRFRTADVFLAMLGIMVVAVTIQWFSGNLERWLTPWRRGTHE